MVTRPPSFNAYEFVVVAALRSHQLMSGCVPQIEGDHKATTMAQLEVASGRITRVEVATDVVVG
jgi:DNA-directed RNA polymerase subunit K/omega